LLKLKAKLLIGFIQLQTKFKNQNRSRQNLTCPLQLHCESGAWERHDHAERERLVYRVRVRMDGSPGEASLCACDAAAADGESLLEPDTLKVCARHPHASIRLHQVPPRFLFSARDPL
jgi:hypothetical protein